jgi:rod shape determining protein RodA
MTELSSSIPFLRHPAVRRLWEQLAIATNWPVLVAVSVLASIGVISIWADRDASGGSQGPKQLMFLVIAIVGMFAFQAVDYRRIGRYAWGFYFVSLALLAYTLLPFVRGEGFLRVPYRGGAYAWINLGFMTLQPAELTKIAFILVLARYLRFRSNYRSLKGLLAPFALAIVPVGMILKQPDLGTALTFIPTLFGMLFVAGARLKHLLAIVGMAVAMAPIGWLSGTDIPLFRHLPEIVKPYQRQRVIAMFSNDTASSRDTNFQITMAHTAMGSGGLAGKGFGNVPVGTRVPEAHNDMIFALVGEQFGFFGCLVVLAAYIVLFTAGVEISAANKEPFGKLVAIGIVAILAGQTFINLMVVTKLMPVTGVTLPFISYGGSSLLASFLAAGLLLNVGQNRPVVLAKDSFEFD